MLVVFFGVMFICVDNTFIRGPTKSCRNTRTARITRIARGASELLLQPAGPQEPLESQGPLASGPCDLSGPCDPSGSCDPSGPCDPASFSNNSLAPLAVLVLLQV